MAPLQVLLVVYHSITHTHFSHFTLTYFFIPAVHLLHYPELGLLKKRRKRNAKDTPKKRKSLYNTCGEGEKRKGGKMERGDDWLGFAYKYTISNEG